MNQASWERLVDAIDIKFGIRDHGSSEQPLEDQPELKEKTEFITFEKEGSEYRVDRITRPAVAERKTFYHRAASSDVRFENIYDRQNTVSYIKLSVKEGESWREIDPEELSFE